MVRENKKSLHNGKIKSFIFGHKLVVLSFVLVLLLATAGSLYAYVSKDDAPVFNTEQAEEVELEQPLIDNPESLEELGITLKAIEDSPSVSVTDGKCDGDKVYSYDPNGYLSITSMQRGGKYVCTTYEVNTIRTYVNNNGVEVTEETYANPDTGTRQTVRKTEGTNEVNVGYEDTDGSGMSWGGEGEEKCFGPNNTVCTIIDTGVTGYEDMLKICILVPASGGYWKLGTASDNLASKNTGTYWGSCSQWQSYKNLFYNK